MNDEAPFHPPVAQPLSDVSTERLELRRFEHADLDALADVFAKPEVWHYPYGRGFTRGETAVAALNQAFGPLGLQRVCSVPQIDNQASVRVAERLGMTKERDIEVPANEKRGTVLGALYWITATEWPSLR